MYRVFASLLLVALSGNTTAAELEVRLDRMRSQQGLVHLCLTRNPVFFPDCGKDPRAVKRSVAGESGPIRFNGLEPGSYALSAFHDENRNGRLDTLVGIPREGFGFSRNPVIRFGPPRFEQVRIDVDPGFSRHTVRMQYLL